MSGEIVNAQLRPTPGGRRDEVHVGDVYPGCRGHGWSDEPSRTCRLKWTTTLLISLPTLMDEITDACHAVDRRVHVQSIPRARAPSPGKDKDQ